MTINFYYYSKDSQIKQLKLEMDLVSRGVEVEGINYFENLELGEYRITWIKTDGSVIYDSAADTSSMTNHLEREEIQQAIEKGYGESSRYSNTMLQQYIYVAEKLNDDTIIRLSTTQNSIWYMLIKVFYPIYIVMLLAIILSVVIAFRLSKKIVEPLNNMNIEDPKSVECYKELEPLLERLNYQQIQLKKDKEELEKNSRYRQEFTANVSHELKTPLHVISGYSELIKNGMVQNEDIKQFAETIYNESRRMSNLVEDILELSKLDTGVVDSKKEKIDIYILCQNVLDSLQSVADEKNISLKLRGSSCNLMGIPNILYGIIYNICDNAIKYNKQNGSVTVEINNNVDLHPQVIISDTGIGIAKEALERIFERFYRVDKSRSREMGGTGLGLSIVKHGLMIHKATINVESTLKEGSRFIINF